MVVQARHNETIPMRRIIMAVADQEGVEVGHANGNPLDCRRENLVVRSTQERTWTTRKRRTHNGRPCSSRFKGVSWHPQNACWRAQITADGRTHHLGTFDNEMKAAQAYDEAAREHFGEHAWLNFPDDRSAERTLTMPTRAAA